MFFIQEPSASGSGLEAACNSAAHPKTRAAVNAFTKASQRAEKGVPLSASPASPLCLLSPLVGSRGGWISPLESSRLLQRFQLAVRRLHVVALCRGAQVAQAFERARQHRERRPTRGQLFVMFRVQVFRHLHDEAVEQLVMVLDGGEAVRLAHFE